MAAATPSMRNAAAKFFTASQFAVAGASSISSKFGYKIFHWYLQENLSAIPVNPTMPSITVSGKEFPTLPSPSKVSDPQHTSLSVITPPKITANLLREAKEAGILAVWLQPGSFTDVELKYAEENWPGAAVGGYADEPQGHDGWCVLVDGYAAMEAAEKLQSKAKRQVGTFEVKRGLGADGRSTEHHAFKRRRPKRTDPVVGRKARVKKHVMDRVGRTENIRLRRVLANLER